jgi:restriction system protein
MWAVGRPAVQAFAGSLEGMKARKGVMITTSQFTKEAKEYVKIIEKRIILIDGDKLTQLMIDFGVGVSEIQTYTLQKIDSDYFDEDI